MIVIAIDPPQGLALWSPQGPQVLQSALVGVLAAQINAWLEEHDGERAILAVEHPHGGDNVPSIRSIILQAISSGWWKRQLELCASGMPERSVAHPMASEWRKHIGFNRGRREDQKEMAIGLAQKAFSELGRRWPSPRGGKWEHAAEACCMALALYTSEADPRSGDPAFTWVRTGRFSDGLSQR